MPTNPFSQSHTTRTPTRTPSHTPRVRFQPKTVMFQGVPGYGKGYANRTVPYPPCKGGRSEAGMIRREG